MFNTLVYKLLMECHCPLGTSISSAVGTYAHDMLVRMCVCTNMASSFVCVCNRHFMHLVVAHWKCVHCVCVLCMLSDPDKADLNVIVSTNGTASENGPKLVHWVMIPPPIPHIHLVRYSV